MASAEARAGYAVNRCFTRDFSMSPSDYQSPVSKKLESDFIHSDDSTDSDMKWWLHVKTNLGSDANYSWESKFDAFNVDIGSDQSVKNLDSLSCVGSVTNTIALEQQWNVYPKCIQKINDTKTAKIEAALNNDLHLAPRKKIEGEFWFSDDVSSVLVSKQCKSTSSDLESYWLRGEKTRPWWDTTGKDDLGYLVAKKSRDNDNDKNVVSSLSRKCETRSSEADGCQSTTLTSGYSFQDSNRTFSSSESKDSDSSNMNTESTAKAELLKALCRSQTRAREAEKAAQEACDEKEQISALFFKQALQLFAYKQWLHVLQLENICLQFKNKNQPLMDWDNLFSCRTGKQHRKNRGKVTDRRRRGIGKCVFAFAVGLALAGAGLLLGWTIGCMFPSF
ncbi:uncharacterized protein LOC127091934 [Lathyrus oleraceus]|uniref:Uncharacterized protein n=1 Tax=Pisum sativum TaxID=3888 RepID=A0A9D5A4J8_PEA|nr:uncharacterized protein LOC127091934 [Pisum sativum]XP_050886637.1 uncharacterized protein LOC127091934 [Pisum sativum]KAI5394118.1 hypothetical protein KIW84_060992 [Pisum sativum]